MTTRCSACETTVWPDAPFGDGGRPGLHNKCHPRRTMTTTDDPNNRLTIPAYAADTLNETLTLTAPAEWHDRIRKLAPRCAYGPNHHRAVIELLTDMSRQCERGYSAAAYDSLLAAERIAS